MLGLQGEKKTILRHFHCFYQINELDQELEQVEQNEIRRQGHVRELTSQLETLEGELAQMTEVDVTPQLEENARNLRAVNGEMQKLQHQEGETQAVIKKLTNEINGENNTRKICSDERL